MVVLVTGCRSGFGLVTAVAAGRAGHTVYAGVRSVADVEVLRAAVEGLDVRLVALDVTDASQRERVVDGIIAEHGRIDALVNNAGVALGGFQEEVDETEVRHVFEVNVFAMWALTQRVIPSMRQQRRGIIINVGSMAGRVPLPGLGIYASSKFAVEGLSESLRHELAPFGVRVVLVEPGPYTTAMTQGPNRRLSASTNNPASPYAAFVARTEALAKKMEDRMGDPHEVAALIVRLLDHPHPRLRYPVGPGALVRLWIRWALPFAVWEWMVARLLRPRA